MLKLEADAVWRTHKESGAEFLLRAIGGLEYETMKSQSLREGALNFPIFCGKFAAAAIEQWRGVVDRAGAAVECTAEVLVRFGEVHSMTVMPWLIDEATSLSRYLDEARAQGKAG